MSYALIEEMPPVKDILQKASDEIKAITGITVMLHIDAFPEKIKSRERKMILMEMICKQFDVTHEQLIGTGRKKNVIDARHAYMYISVKVLKISQTETGKDLNGRDHTTVGSAVKKVVGFYKSQDPLINTIEDLKKRLPND